MLNPLSDFHPSPAAMRVCSSWAACRAQFRWLVSNITPSRKTASGPSLGRCLVLTLTCRMRNAPSSSASTASRFGMSAALAFVRAVWIARFAAPALLRTALKLFFAHIPACARSPSTGAQQSISFVRSSCPLCPHPPRSCASCPCLRPVPLTPHCARPTS